ncbi:MAG: hypothetical protein ACR5K9_05350 [Wolbachia sp.]
MSNLFKKNNVPYLIASSLATLTLISSLVFAVTSSVPLLLILALVSVSVIALSCRAIGNNKKMEVKKNKFTQKEQELENKITLEKEAGEDANKEVERLSNQLNKLTEEKRGLEREVKNLNQKVNQLEAEKDNLSQEKESFGRELDGKTNRIAELCRTIDELEKIINIPYEQEKKSYRKQQIRELRCKQMRESRYAQMKKLLHRKISRLREWLQEAEGDLTKKNKYIAGLEGKISDIKYEESKNRELDKEEKLGELQRNVKELTKKNKSLSKKLSDANGYLENQSVELERINKHHDDQEKKLKNSLLQKDNKIEQLREDLSGMKEEQVNFMQNMIKYVVSKVEESVKGSEEIRNDDKTVILQIIQEIKSVLEEEVVKYLPHETSRMEEDPGYTSRCTTPVSQLYDPMVECIHRTKMGSTVFLR